MKNLITGNKKKILPLSSSNSQKNYMAAQKGILTRKYNNLYNTNKLDYNC